MKRYNILLLVGAVFLFNPVVNIADFLPNAIGYVLIFIGLAPYAAADSSMYDARKTAAFLIATGAVKLLLTPSVAVSLQHDDKLLATFAFAIVETIFSLMFVTRFFGGVETLSDRRKGECVSALCADSAFLTKLFLLCSIWLPVLPELTALAVDTANSGVENSDEYMMLAGSKWLITAFIVLVALVIGIIWLVRMIRLYNAAKKDVAALDSIAAEYAEQVAAKQEEAVLLGTRRAVWLSAFAVACFADLVINSVPLAVPPLGILLFSLMGFVLGERKVFSRLFVVGIICGVADYAAEIAAISLIPNDMMHISQITPQMMITAIEITVVTAAAWICFRLEYVAAFRALCRLRSTYVPSMFGTTVLFTAMLIIRSERLLLPFLRQWTTLLYAVLTAIWAVLTVLQIIRLRDEVALKSSASR